VASILLIFVWSDWRVRAGFPVLIGEKVVDEKRVEVGADAVNSPGALGIMRVGFQCKS